MKAPSKHVLIYRRVDFHRPSWATGWLERPFYSVAINRPEGFIQTTFWEGSQCDGSPIGNDPEKYLQTARYAGYGTDVERMAIENDLLHSFLSERAGFPFSCALYGSATKRWFPWWEQEEAAVFAMQRLLNAGALSAHEAAALTLYAHWVRPGTDTPALADEARAWMQELLP